MVSPTGRNRLSPRLLYQTDMSPYAVRATGPEDPQSTYLSACHTTVGDGESPDEVIHLASVMQFAGFRWVIIRLDHRSDNLHVVALVLGTSQSQSLHRVRPVACDPPDDPTLKKGSSRQGEMR